MPIHDWSRVRAGMFHHFHNSWIYKLSDRLNAGILPKKFYAAGQRSIEDMPDVVMYRSADELANVAKQDHIVVRSSVGDKLVALIEIVSRGNKDSRPRLQTFVDKVTTAIERGCHVLVIDLFPPGRLDPQGIHGAVWSQLVAEDFGQPSERPLTFAAYRATPQPVAYVEPAAVGDPLPAMPLFLGTDWYVSAPLTESYDEAWNGFPEPWKRVVAQA